MSWRKELSSRPSPPDGRLRDEIFDEVITYYLVTAAEILHAIYSAQRQGRELSPADQTELEILSITRPNSTIAKGQGFGLTAVERRAVELRAMTLAEDWLRWHGYRPKETSSNKPYDFEARKRDECLFVEVKGTTSEKANAIAMTRGEVDLQQREKGNTILLIVTGIRLNNSDTNG